MSDSKVTALSREELERLDAAATKGPWHRSGPEVHAPEPHSEAMPYTTVARVGLTTGNAQEEWANADLIVHLRNSVPSILALLDRVERLERVRAAADAVVERLDDHERGFGEFTELRIADLRAALSAGGEEGA